MELTSLHKKSYGAWAGFPAGHAPDPERCVEEVRAEGRWPLYHQCNRKRGHGPEGAYCKQHSPEAKAARAEKAEAKYRAQERKWRIEWAAPAAIKTLEQIADGHNDPRALALDFLRNNGFRK